jgi:TPR repeat protein
VRAADNALIKSCEGFDKVNAQNMFLPTPMHSELYNLHKRAVERDPHAQAELADRYMDGRAVPKDWKTAICWYRAAAQSGSTYAEFWLGLFYQHGWFVTESAEVAAYWFSVARHHRDTPAAERQVADRYANDDSSVYDMGQALIWYERAAKQRDLQAELALGNFYITSHTPGDIQRALSWYGKASAQHSVAADYNIGQIYYRGVGIQQNLKEAHKWLLRAAERGYRPAQYDLAEMYYQGVGVPQDWIKSYAWLEVSAAAENNPAAQRLQDMLVTHFNPEQLAQAAHLARDYKARYAR